MESLPNLVFTALKDTGKQTDHRFAGFPVSVQGLYLRRTNLMQ